MTFQPTAISGRHILASSKTNDAPVIVLAGASWHRFAIPTANDAHLIAEPPVTEEVHNARTTRAAAQRGPDQADFRAS